MFLAFYTDIESSRAALGGVGLELHGFLKQAAAARHVTETRDRQATHFWLAKKKRSK